MFDFNFIFYVGIVLVVVLSSFLLVKIYQQQNRLENQDIRLAQMYLDKQFCVRLLNLILQNHDSQDLTEFIGQEIKGYFAFNDFAIVDAKTDILLIKANSLREKTANIVAKHKNIINKKLNVIPWTIINTEDALYKYGITRIDDYYICFVMNKTCSLNKIEQETLSLDIPRIILIAYQLLSFREHPV